MGWIHELVSMHEELESPKSFWFWSGLATISAVVKDNVWINRWAYNLYPNIFVMLHADSGMKKGAPVNLAKELVGAVNNTKIYDGRASFQGILKNLSMSATEPGGKIPKGSTGFIVASEFSSSIVNDPAAMTMLTDLYDRQWHEGKWNSILKMEEFSLNKPTISLLAATNEAHFNDFLEYKDMKGGFIGRMFMIAESEVQVLNSLMAPPTIVPDKSKLIAYLKQLSNIKGPFQDMGASAESDEYPIPKKGKWYNQAGIRYDNWYEQFYQDFKESGTKDDTGTIQRFGDSVLKIAMLLSLSDSTNLVISEQHILGAITLGEKLIGNVRQTTDGKINKKDSNSDRKDTLLRELYRRNPHIITQQQLLRKYWMQGNINEWDICVETLVAAGQVKIENMGNTIIYRMPDSVVEDLNRIYRGKQR